WRWCLERAEEFDLESKDKAQLYAQIWDCLDRGGASGEDVGRVLDEWQRMLEATVAEAPGPHAFAEQAALAEFLLDKRGDAAAAAPLIERLVAFDPDSGQYLALKARCARLLGHP